MANNVPKSKKNKVFRRLPLGWIFAIIIFYLLITSLNMSITGVPKEMSYGQFYKVLRDDPKQIKSVTKIETILQGELANNTKFFVNIPENDPELLNLMRQNLEEHFEIKPARTFWVGLLFNLGPILLLIFSGG